MKGLIVAAAAALLAACAIPQQGMKGGSPFYSGMKKGGYAAAPAAAPQYVDETIEIRTEPPGARIHVNDVFAGYAPVKYTVRRLWRGQPGYMVLDTVKVEALPVAAGQCVQSGIYGEASRKIVSPVSFNMTACSPAAPAGAK